MHFYFTTLNKYLATYLTNKNEIEIGEIIVDYVQTSSSQKKKSVANKNHVNLLKTFKYRQKFF